MWTFPLVPSFISFRQPHNSCHDWFHHVILKSLSSSSLSSLSAFIAPSLFHSRLKTYVFHNPSHHNRLEVPPLTVFTGPDVACSLVYFQFISTPPPVSTAWPVTRLLYEAVRLFVRWSVTKIGIRYFANERNDCAANWQILTGLIYTCRFIFSSFFSLISLFVPCGGLSWLHVTSLNTQYRIVSIRTSGWRGKDVKRDQWGQDVKGQRSRPHDRRQC